MNLQKLVNAMNELVTNGQLTDAAEEYYASNIKTIEFDATVTEGKQAAMKKLNDFLNSIEKVKQIELRRSVADGDASFSEYVLNFEMKDGTNSYLHEVIRSLWENGQVVEERYFIG
ncbi:MAG: hypothetical protein JWR54_1159 [Mucilaginibacter sp.]|nr:hypothetical protein [Mucilaginibacter sp.]